MLDKAREREPADRYPDVAAFRGELARVVALPGGVALRAGRADARWLSRSTASASR